MNMFKSFLNAIPKNRSDFVNELDLDDLVLEPFVFTEPEDAWSRSDSLLSESTEECDWNTNRTASTDSSVALSRAMTDSDIDYDRYRRIMNRSFSDPWVQMKAALDAFPPQYLASVNSFQTSISTSTEDSASTPTHTYKRRSYVEELRQKMERFFEEECRVFTPDDPGLEELESALQSLDLKEERKKTTEVKLIHRRKTDIDTPEFIRKQCQKMQSLDV